METFALLTRLAQSEREVPSKREEHGREWLRQVHEKCPGVRFLSHFAVMGPYDFLSVFEAPDAETAAKVSLISMARGASAAESWTLLPYDRFLELARQI